jgi:ABC-type Na+ efflux pump permease subunit
VVNVLDTTTRPPIRTVPARTHRGALTWRDVVTTGLAVFGAFVVLAVERGWDWPLLGSYRSSSLVLGAMGIAMCAVGGSTTKDMSFSDPFIQTASVLGFAALVFIVTGLVSPTRAVFLALAVTTLALWLIATIRHAVSH